MKNKRRAEIDIRGLSKSYCKDRAGNHLLMAIILTTLATAASSGCYLLAKNSLHIQAAFVAAIAAILWSWTIKEARQAMIWMS